MRNKISQILGDAEYFSVAMAEFSDDKLNTSLLLKHSLKSW
jgi:hypothetical protein